MKLTQRQIKRIVKQELKQVLKEQHELEEVRGGGSLGKIASMLDQQAEKSRTIMQDGRIDPDVRNAHEGIQLIASTVATALLKIDSVVEGV